MEVGYQSVDEAVVEFERHFNKELKLPTRVPPISFTHQFGRFNNLDGEINDTLEVIFVNEQLLDHHFKIDVRPIEDKIKFEQYESKVFKLKNGKNARYIENQIRHFHLLIFETGEWQYVFSIDKDVSEEVTPEILVQIANSIDF
jgi:phosphatidate phosphatase PAH1